MEPGIKPTDDQRRFNEQVTSICFVVEQAIAHIKNWHIMTARYRGHLDHINNVILAAVGLQILNDCLSDCTLSFSRLNPEESFRIASMLSEGVEPDRHRYEPL